MGNTVCGAGDRRNLLDAAAHHDGKAVEEILRRRPELVGSKVVTDGNGALHLAAASGDLRVCRLLMESIQEKFEAASRSKNQTHQGKCVWEWRQLMLKALNRRDGLHMTPLMLACKHGHTPVVLYLLAQGADPLIVDRVTHYTCLHLAAYHGHTSVVHALLGEGTLIERAGRRVPLKTCTVQYTGGTCRYIDCRAMHGVTAVHLAAAFGHAETAAALLRLGASMAVRTVGSVQLGELSVTMGATPLHLAAKTGDMATLQALLQAYVDGLGTPNTKPGERRVDLRRVRDSSRALPYHVAARSGNRPAAELLDPRTVLDQALDNCRDTSAGIGPQKLSTIAARVLRWSHVQWLDEADRKMDEQERAMAVRMPRSSSVPATPRLPSAAGAAGAPAAAQQQPADVLIGRGGGGSCCLPAGCKALSVAAEEEEGMEAGDGEEAGGAADKLLPLPGPVSEQQQAPQLSRSLSTPVLGAAPHSGGSGGSDGGGGAGAFAQVEVGAAVSGVGAGACSGGARACSGSAGCSKECVREREASTEAATAAGGGVAGAAVVRQALLDFRDSFHARGEEIVPGAGTELAECSICVSEPCWVAVDVCNHDMCANCARRLCLESQKEPLCPFCRRIIGGFHVLS